MGRKLDRFLGRAHRVSKFKPLVNLAVSRLAVLKTQRHPRLSQSRRDVVQLLQLGHHERALLRVEQVIKEQNMLDAYDMMESYCNLLMERADLIEQEKECPEELKEAISSLIYASSRCGDFPELQDIRTVFASHFGKEFVARAVELRNHCAVNLKMITKLSTRQPNWESRVKALKEIAAENGIALHLEDDPPSTSEDKTCLDKKPELAEGSQSSSPEGKEEPSSDSFQMKKKYKDVADAAQAAFESAAYAAAAARAAVELSRSGSNGPDDRDGPDTRKAKSFHKAESANKLEVQGGEEDGEHQAPDKPLGVNAGESKQSISSSSSKPEEIDATSLEKAKEAIFDESEDEREDEGRAYTGLPNQDDGKSKDGGKVEATPRLSPQKQIPSRFQAGIKMDADPGLAKIHAGEASKVRNVPFSVRTRQVRGY
ncbi:vacuolar protein sorting-associated protein IST1 [Rhodamnia argentea]|uniref:Vacuolar protein sorting-associated protein IST1 n=1 Tax=Rhodamnia argentea TaxID=178133 RepID=A0A8B8QSH1_9MYRT|nr:vacuolar protein sorting-associated protein IST1 [Rhodamnia argentea]